jgi:hypothetical protein
MNTVLLVLLVGFFLGAVIAFFLRLGARWAKSPQRSFLGAFAVVVVLAVFAFGVLCAAETTLGLDPPTVRAWVPTGVVLAVGGVLVPAWRYRTGVFGTVRVLVGLAAGVGLAVGLANLVVAPYLFEVSRATRSGSMAPSSRGLHAVQVCPKCGGELIVPLTLSDEDLAAGKARGKKFDAICADCLAHDKVHESFEHLRPRDLRFTNKTATPRRWDRIVFREPLRADQRDVIAVMGEPDPSAKWAKRLVGLPGEEVVIREGAVWIDYVADLGDGFDATYAMGCLLARETLVFRRQGLAARPIAGDGRRRGLPACFGRGVSRQAPDALPVGLSRSASRPHERPTGLCVARKPRLV